MHFLYSGAPFRISGGEMDYTLKIIFIVVLLWSDKASSAPRKRRLSSAAPSPSYYLKDIDGVSGTYAFGYDVFDPQTGNTQFRIEERYPNGTVVGSYGYVDARGKSQKFDYVADGKGYRVLHAGGPLSEKYEQLPSQTHEISTEPSVSWSRPRKPYKKKSRALKIPSNILEPPLITILD